jgi:hypothetical protein
MQGACSCQGLAGGRAQLGRQQARAAAGLQHRQAGGGPHFEHLEDVGWRRAVVRLARGGEVSARQELPAAGGHLRAGRGPAGGGGVGMCRTMMCRGYVAA